MYSCHGVDVSQAIRESCVKFIRSAEGQRIVQSSIRSSLSKSPVRSSSKRGFIKSSFRDMGGFTTKVWEAMKEDYGEGAYSFDSRMILNTLLGFPEVFDNISNPTWQVRVQEFKSQVDNLEVDEDWDYLPVIKHLVYEFENGLDRGILK